MSATNWLAIAGLIIITALALYAYVLWRKVWDARQAKAEQERGRNERLAQDIQFLAQSLLNGQLPLVEGSIRIKVLLDNYSGPRRTDLDVGVFEVIYNATAHIPTHQQWKDLPRTERQQHEQQMQALEQEHKEEVERAAGQLSTGVAPSQS
ncbi:MAG: DUF2489 domain-containing protein [Pseudomonas profundi]|uniref:DUF2489 domain-containing protein n=1 Tax=Pseudomonas profundi TaxID=1981513 RepID=UPI0030018F68